MSLGYQIQNVEVRYDQADFRAYQEQLAAKRLAYDAKRLREVFSVAGHNRTFERALHWAESHGVQFMIDYTCRGAGGYYVLGNGVVAITQNGMRTNHQAAEIITHEIRHAWQDYYGFIPATGRSLSEYYIKLALVEADAHAHQSVAAEENRLEGYRQRNSPDMAENMKALQKEAENGDSLLRHFEEWYVPCKGKAMFYGVLLAKSFGEQLGIDNVVAMKLNSEFKSAYGAGRKGIEIATTQQVRAIGKSFNGVNYLKNMSNDRLLREMLSPALAHMFFGAAHATDKKLITEVRKRHLSLKKAAGKDVYL